LWIVEEDRECIVNRDATSFFIENGRKEMVKTTTLLKYLEENKIDHVDFLQINCEGSEWALMRYILDNKLDEKVSRIRVQYHPQLKDKVSHYEDIETQLDDFIKRGWKRDMTPDHMWWNIYREAYGPIPDGEIRQG